MSAERWHSGSRLYAPKCEGALAAPALRQHQNLQSVVLQHAAILHLLANEQGSSLDYVFRNMTCILTTDHHVPSLIFGLLAWYAKVSTWWNDDTS